MVPWKKENSHWKPQEADHDAQLTKTWFSFMFLRVCVLKLGRNTELYVGLLEN